MLMKLIVPFIAIILSIWNILSPIKSDGSIVIRFAKKNSELWNISQRIYAIQTLVLNIIFCVIAINFKNSNTLNNNFIIFVIVVLIQLIPILSTYIILKIKYKKLYK